MNRKDATVINVNSGNAAAIATTGAGAQMVAMLAGNANGKGTAAGTGQTLSLGLWGEDAAS